MIQLTAALGLILGGLFILWSQGLPVLRAVRSGVWTSKSLNRPSVSRQDDPDRFAGLIRERSRGLGPAVAMIVVGALLLAQFVWFVGEAERRAQLPNPYLDGR